MKNIKILANGDIKFKTDGDKVDITKNEFLEILTQVERSGQKRLFKFLEEGLKKDLNEKFEIIYEELKSDIKSNLVSNWLEIVNWLFGAIGFSKEQLKKLEKITKEYDEFQ